MKQENPIKDKSFQLAIRVVNLSKHLMQAKQEFVMSKQLLRCGTSIGANVREAQDGESSADFIHKLSIALKESGELLYWLDLLHATNFLTDSEYDSICTDATEVRKILVKIIKSTKKRS
jgi:four helix bundle protein